MSASLPASPPPHAGLGEGREPSGPLTLGVRLPFVRALGSEARVHGEKARGGPQSSEHWEGLAQSAYECEDFATAERCMRRAFELGDGDATMYYNLGQILYALGDYGGAAEAYGRSLPEVKSALVNRGLCWELTGFFDRARIDYMAALRDDPNDVDALVNLGTLELSGGDVAAARDLLSRATALDETCHWQLADVHEEAGELRMAVQSLRRAIAAGEDRARPQHVRLRRRLRLQRRTQAWTRRARS
ncbi:tetratricopeptide repeat protein [Microbacterium sp. che218]|uniref:tetratricopeptide repeat protein n=1 Tax=Microbacterium sp. che218 TaxID=3140649 RepID=UPI00336BD83D